MIHLHYDDAYFVAAALLTIPLTTIVGFYLSIIDDDQSSFLRVWTLGLLASLFWPLSLLVIVVVILNAAKIKPTSKRNDPPPPPPPTRVSSDNKETRRTQ